MSKVPEVTVRVIAALYGYRSDRGLPTTVHMDVPAEGMDAREIAAALDLPMDLVEGAFVNHRKSGLDTVVRPGDRVVLVPRGTPASHPAFFGPFESRDAGDERVQPRRTGP